jgi:hypothetical protein
LVLLVKVLKEERRGLEEEFREGEKGYKVVRYQLLILIVEVLKEEGFEKGVRKRGLEKGFGKGKEGYKIVRYQFLILIKVLIKVLIEEVLVEDRSFWY